MTQEHNGAASGVTNEGSVLVCLNYGDQYLTAEMVRYHVNYSGTGSVVLSSKSTPPMMIFISRP